MTDLLDRGESTELPLLVTADGRTSSEQRILYCNPAFAAMCGYARAELESATPRMLQGPETDRTAARAFAERMAEHRHASVVLINYKADGTPYYVEIIAVRCPAPAWLQAGRDEVSVAFERSLGDLERGGEAGLDRSYRLALLFESVLRRHLQHHHRRGLHPAQWSALRYFRLAGPQQRTLSDFARSHRTTMGTASTTVSTLVGKGYLVKQSFRGPIELTDSGLSVLQEDPLDEVAATLADLDATGTRWAERILLTLAGRLDAGSRRD